MRIPTQAQTSPTQAAASVSSSNNNSSSSSNSSSNSTTNNNSGTCSSSTKFMPLLNVIARPKNTLPPAVAMSQRKELDAKVKSVLVKSAQEFVEWLLGEGLIRTSQYCSTHKMQPSLTPIKLKVSAILHLLLFDPFTKKGISLIQ
nr:uncharacterized protein LOC128688076 [Cherax quadricarinatus]